MTRQAPTGTACRADREPHIRAGAPGQAQDDRGASDGRAGDREPGADERQRRLGVARLGDRREGELGDGARTKDRAVG